LVALCFAVLAFVTFGLVMKVAGQRGQPPTPVAAVNYIFAAVICLAIALWSDRSGFASMPLVLLGVGAGIGFVAGFYVNFSAIDRAGLAVAQPVAGIASLVPVLVGVAFWHESPSLAQKGAMLLACAALVLLGSSANGDSARHQRGLAKAWPILILLFLVQGLAMTTTRALKQFGLAEHLWAYQALLFGSAALGAGLVWARTRDPLRPLGLGLGLIFGTANIAGTALLLVALATLSGVVVYPINSVGSMVLGAVLAMVIWHERPGPRAIAGILLAIPAVLLLSL